MISSRTISGVCAVVMACVACESTVTDSTGSGASGGNGGSGAGGGAGGNGGEGGSTSDTTSSTGGTVATNSTIDTSMGGQGGGGGGPCDPGMSNVDDDGDGYTELDGDCGDCDAAVNPGSIEVIAEPGPDEQLPEPKDEDCDGQIDNVAPPCDDGLALDDADPMSGAKAIDLCKTVTPGVPKWGVLEAAYVRADGTGVPAALQRGIKPGFGTNVNVQKGSRLLVLSNGNARDASDPDPCGFASCAMTDQGTAPPGLPQDVPGCDVSQDIFDDVALELEIRTPKNATGYAFDFKLHSFEYPSWVCTDYNDQFVAVVQPAPIGAVNGNIVFDAMGKPASVNMELFEVCDPATETSWAANCFANCPPVPNPYCPLGAADLVGTGFDVWGDSGATGWLTSQAPVTGGETITVRLTVMDVGDQNLDSTVLIDDWRWITNGDTVQVQTKPVPDPK